MANFNPSFHFDTDDATPLSANSAQPTLNTYDYTRTTDKLIDDYRIKIASEIADSLGEEHDVDEPCNTTEHVVSDSLRNRSKRKRNKLVKANAKEEEEEQYEFAQCVTKYIDVESFMSFKLAKPLLKSLTEMRAFKPTPIQCACIPLGLLNRDICACARTGSGKTLAFLLPVLDRLVYAPSVSRGATRALIVSPTRELAVQIFKVAEQLVRHCPRLNVQLAVGGLNLSSEEASLRTNPDIVVATPGRLLDHLSNAPNFSLSKIEFLVLDEADRLLDEYFTEQIGAIIKHCSSQRQTLLFSATMTETVRELATVSLKNPVRIFLNQSTAVATGLDQEFVRIRPHREGDRDAILTALLLRTFPRRTIVFLPTKKDCHRIHILLGLMGVKCAELHGDMNQSQRLEALRRFTDAETLKLEAMNKVGSEAAFPAQNCILTPPADILLTTDLAARGLDIPGVLTVINYKLPNNIKSYVHRVGRTARASNPGRAVSLAGEGDRKLLKEIVKNAPCPVKARVISQEVITRFQARMDRIKPFVEEILSTELEERELNAAQAQLAKAEGLALHGRTECRRPNWFSEKRDAERLAKRSRKGNRKSSNKRQRMK